MQYPTVNEYQATLTEIEDQVNEIVQDIQELLTRMPFYDYSSDQLIIGSLENGEDQDKEYILSEVYHCIVDEGVSAEDRKLCVRYFLEAVEQVNSEVWFARMEDTRLVPEDDSEIFYTHSMFINYHETDVGTRLWREAIDSNTEMLVVYKPGGEAYPVGTLEDPYINALEQDHVDKIFANYVLRAVLADTFKRVEQAYTNMTDYDRARSDSIRHVVNYINERIGPIEDMVNGDRGWDMPMVSEFIDYIARPDVAQTITNTRIFEMY